jgi:hypothetical protein
MFLLLVAGATAFAQAPPDPAAFRNGQTYTFERKFATRKVHDAFDNGLRRDHKTQQAS